jgi:hypothetical protein
VILITLTEFIRILAKRRLCTNIICGRMSHGRKVKEVGTNETHPVKARINKKE